MYWDYEICPTCEHQHALGATCWYCEGRTADRLTFNYEIGSGIEREAG